MVFWFQCSGSRAHRALLYALNLTSAACILLSLSPQASPEEFTEALKMREAFYGKGGASPSGSIENVPAGAFYLKEVAGNFNRIYARK